MNTRTSRYAPSETKENKPTRIKKNNYLYDDLNNKIGIEEYVDINTQTRINLMEIRDENNKRENYHQLKEYQSIIGMEEKRPVTKLEIEEEEEKIYNINDVLEEARKNRQKDFEKETRRKLADEEYNVLNSLNEKYLIGKNEAEDIEGLQELIDTVTKRIPVEEIQAEEEKDLLSDLLETRQIEAADVTEETKEDENKEEEKQPEIDNSFYTKSMELSNADFYDEDEETKGSKRPFLIALVIVILIALIVGIVYFVLPMLG